MPKSTQTTNSASRHSLRRNQVQFFIPFLSRLFTPPQACLTCRKRKLVWYRYFSPTRTPQIASFLEMRCRTSSLCNMRQVRTLVSLGRASDLILRQTMACSDQRAASTRIRVSSLSVFCYIYLTSLPPVGTPPNLNAHMIPWRVYHWQPMPIP
jgi:hypothetical protein